MGKSVQRIYYIDWLRIFGIGVIFLFHTLCIFSKAPWIVNDYETNIFINYFLGFLVKWMMPLFFLISGSVMYYSLYFKGSTGFLRDKFKRLIIPYIFGVFFIAPIVVYIERIFDGNFTGNFIEFYTTTYFQGFYGFGGNFAWMGLHLWYLLFLFIFIIIGYKPAKYFLKEREKPLFDNISKYMDKTGVIFLLIIPIIILFYISRLEPMFLGREIGRWSILVYSPFFFYGFLFAYDKRYDIAIKKNWKIAFIISIFSTFFSYWLVFNNLFSLDYYNPIVLIPAVVTSFSTLIALLGLFRNKFNKKSPYLFKLNEAVLPFYILHLPIIVLVGYFVVNLEFVMIFKLVLIIIVSLFLIVSIYFFLIKRFIILRVLFGMKPAK